METFNFSICGTDFNISITGSSWEDAESVLQSYIEEHELNWTYNYSNE